MEREVQPLQVGEDPVAERRLAPAGLAEGEPAPQPAADARQHAGHKDRERPPQEGALRVGLDASIDRQRHEGWHCHLADGGREPGHHAYGETPPLPPKLAADEVPARPAGLDIFRRSAFHSVSARPNDS